MTIDGNKDFIVVSIHLKNIGIEVVQFHVH